MDLSRLADRRVPRTFEFDGEPVTIECLPHKITPEYRVRLTALARKAEDGEEAQSAHEREQDAQMIADLMPVWDVQMQGAPFPPTYENLLGVPVTVLGRVSSEIMEVIKSFTSPSKAGSKK